MFSANSTGTFTLTFIDELVIDSTVQGTRLLSALSVETELRSARDFSVGPLIGLAALFNCDFVVAKAALALLAKVSSVNFHESKTYKEAMADAQHKMDWQFGMNDEMVSHRDNKIWVLVDEASKGRKVLIGKWVYRCKRGINEKVTRYKAR